MYKPNKIRYIAIGTQVISTVIIIVLFMLGYMNLYLSLFIISLVLVFCVIMKFYAIAMEEGRIKNKYTPMSVWLRKIVCISIVGIACLLFGIFLFDSMFESSLWKILSVVCFGLLLIFVESIVAVRIYPKVKSSVRK